VSQTKCCCSFKFKIYGLPKILGCKGVCKKGLGLKPRVELDILQKLYCPQRRIIVSTYFCLLICRLIGLSSASKNHLITFCRPFVHYACSKSCSAIVHFIRNNCLYFVCYGWSAHALTALATLPISSMIKLFCSMIKLLQELKNRSFMFQQGKRITKNLLDFYTQ